MFAVAHRPVVLVADDDAAIRQLVTEVLEEALGARVVAVADGRAAITALAGEPPAALVLDLLMPAVDGLAVLRWLRTRPPDSQPPVVALTATSGPEGEAALGLGAAAVVPKPFDVDALAAAVRPLLDGGATDS
jgi:CheY-like chemotaxis protein